MPADLTHTWTDDEDLETLLELTLLVLLADHELTTEERERLHRRLDRIVPGGLDVHRFQRLLIDATVALQSLSPDHGLADVGGRLRAQGIGAQAFAVISDLAGADGLGASERDALHEAAAALGVDPSTDAER